MKSVLISIRPKWCELIASGEKTIEVRKTAPKDVPFKVYIYATKKEYLQWMFRKGDYIFSDDHSAGKFDENIFVKNRYDWQGKVIGEFVCDGVFAIRANDYTHEYIERVACLSHKELEEYQGDEAHVFGWRIFDLKIYDKPKKLSKFRHCGVKLTRPPQSWCYVEELQG